MKAVWYERFGPANEVLTFGDRAEPQPGAGEVLVRLHATGINPSDVKLRGGARPGAVMEYPQVIPHSDGAGLIEAVGPGVDPGRVGQRVWTWNAAWQRPFGTAAEYVALPSHQAVEMPDSVSFREAACFGIPAMTAWTAVFRDGPVAGKTVLVTGGAGTVGRYAIQMARLGGARVITTVSSAEKAAHSTAEEWINYRDGDPAEAVLEMTGGAGVDRIVDVDFAANQAMALKVIKPGGAIAAYASVSEREPVLSFYPFMFKNVTLHMLIVYQRDRATHARGAADLTDWLAEGRLSHAVVPGGTLRDIVKAHERVETGAKLGTVVLDI